MATPWSKRFAREQDKNEKEGQKREEEGREV
jgi:hypothetical protein